MAIAPRPKKDGTISYQVKVKDQNGNWYPQPSFQSLEDAKEEELRLTRLKKKGALAFSEDARTVTFDEFWEVWSHENRTNVSKGWQISQDQMYRDYVKQSLGPMKMIQIGAPEIGHVLKAVRDKGLSDQLVRHVYNLLRKMFADAVEYYEMLAASPVKVKFHRPKVSKKRRDFLLPEQAWRLLEHSRDHFIGPAIWIQVLSGLRPGEVQALRWRCVLPELDHILIRASYNRKTKSLQDHPKQEDWGYAPMPDELKRYLSRLKKDPEDFVAPGPNGGMLVHGTYYKALIRVCRDAGVPEMSPHELRHSCTELYVQQGASTEDLRRLLNHKSLASTGNYIHRTDARLNQIARKIRGPEGDPISQTISQNGNLERVPSQEDGDYVH